MGVRRKLTAPAASFFTRHGSVTSRVGIGALSTDLGNEPLDLREQVLDGDPRVVCELMRGLLKLVDAGLQLVAPLLLRIERGKMEVQLRLVAQQSELIQALRQLVFHVVLDVLGLHSCCLLGWSPPTYTSRAATPHCGRAPPLGGTTSTGRSA